MSLLVRVFLCVSLAVASAGCARSFELLTTPDGGLDGAVPAFNECTAQDAQRICDARDCDGPPDYVWTGHGCTAVACSPSELNCAGDDCDNLYGSASECEAAHVSCVLPSCVNTSCVGSERELCEQSFGTYHDAYCGHARCGVPSPLRCESGGCNCGRQRNFVEGRGCVDDDSCGLPSCGPVPGPLDG